MSRKYHVAAVILALTLAPLPARADVKTEEKSVVKFEGMLGRMIGMFGGRAAREGVISTVAVSGDRKLSLSEYGGQIIDLNEEKVYDLDVRNKTYTVTTFAELRRRMEEARKRAESQAERSEPQQSGERQEAREPEHEIDFDLKESGQRKTINGFDAREVIMTITVRQKGKTLEQGGGLVLRANNWLGPKIAAVGDVAEFDRRYAEKLDSGMAIGVSAEQMAAALAMYPGMQQALSRMRTENVNVDGTPVLTTVAIEAVKNPEEAKRQEDEPAAGAGGGVSGALGGLGRRVMRRRQDSTAENARATVMTMTHELLKVQTSVGPSDVAMPAGFRQK